MPSIVLHGIEQRANGEQRPKLIAIDMTGTEGKSGDKLITLDAGSTVFVQKITSEFGGPRVDVGVPLLVDIIDHAGSAVFGELIGISHLSGNASLPYILPIELRLDGGKQQPRLRYVNNIAPLPL